MSCSIAAQLVVNVDAVKAHQVVVDARLRAGIAASRERGVRDTYRSAPCGARPAATHR